MTNTGITEEHVKVIKDAGNVLDKLVDELKRERRLRIDAEIALGQIADVIHLSSHDDLSVYGRVQVILAQYVNREVGNDQQK